MIYDPKEEADYLGDLGLKQFSVVMFFILIGGSCLINRVKDNLDEYAKVLEYKTLKPTLKRQVMENPPLTKPPELAVSLK